MFDQPALQLLTFVIGVLASFIGTIGSGVGLISFPLLLLVGVPPQVAIATNKFGLVGFDIGPIRTYHKNKKIIWKYVLPFSVLMTTGSVIGAQFLLQIDPTILNKIIVILLIVILFLLFVKKDLGVKRFIPNRQKTILGYIGTFAISVWSGFFTIGSAIFSTFVNLNFFGFTITEQKATEKIPIIISTIVALVIFYQAGIIDFAIGIPLFLGTLTGSFLGGHVVIKKGDNWTKNIVLILILATIVRLLFSNGII